MQPRTTIAISRVDYNQTEHENYSHVNLSSVLADRRDIQAHWSVIQSNLSLGNLVLSTELIM